MNRLRETRPLVVSIQFRSSFGKEIPTGFVLCILAPLQTFDAHSTSSK